MDWLSFHHVYNDFTWLIYVMRIIRGGLFNWLKKYMVRYKGLFGFFGSVVGYIVDRIWALIVSIIKYPLAVIDTFCKFVSLNNNDLCYGLPFSVDYYAQLRGGVSK